MILGRVLSVLGIVTVMVVLVACGSGADTTAPPTSVPTEALAAEAEEPTAAADETPVTMEEPIVVGEDAEEWDYVALGGSYDGGFHTPYGAFIEEDLGVKIALDNRHIPGVMSSSSLLKRLQNNEDMREAVGGAEVITYYGLPTEQTSSFCWEVPNTPYWAELSLDCSPEALAAYRADLEAIAVEIMALRSGSETVIRTLDLHLPLSDEWHESGIYDECRRCMEEANEIIHEVAEEHGIPVARVIDAFNGPSHDESAADNGYVYAVGVQTVGAVNQTGRVIIAEQLRDLGYATSE